MEFGFTDAELNEVKANVENQYEDAAQQMSTRKSRDLANEIARRLGTRRIFTNPKNDYERVSAELETVTADQCRDLLRQLWDGSHEVLVLVSGNAKVENP